MNIKNILFSISLLSFVGTAYLKADKDTVTISNNSLDLVTDFIVSPKDGYPVYVTVYPFEGKSRFNSSGKGKALCEGWLNPNTKITIETHHDLLIHSANNCGFTSTISIVPGKGKEHDECIGQPNSKLQVLSCFVRNTPVDSFVVKFDTKKVTRATGNCTNSTADTKEIRLHANYKQSDWDATYYSISLQVLPDPQENELEEQVMPVGPSQLAEHKDDTRAVQPLPSSPAPAELKEEKESEVHKVEVVAPSDRQEKNEVKSPEESEVVVQEPVDQLPKTSSHRALEKTKSLKSL